MSRPKSDLLSKLGIVFNITKALVDAALRARVEDDETLLRQIEDPAVADGIVKDLMERAGIVKPAPIIDGLTVYEIEVDGNDPRWSKIEPKRYAYCNESARAGDFPVKPGKRIVKYVLLPFSFDPTNQQVIDDTTRRNLTRPDRAITETILDARSAECVEKPIVGVCGVVQSGTGGDLIVGCVNGRARGRGLDLDVLRGHWDRLYQFVAVVSE